MSFGESRLHLSAFQEYAKWIGLSEEEREIADVRPMVKAAALHLNSSPAFAEVAPCLSIMYFGFHEYDIGRVPWLARWAISFFIWVLRIGAYRGRPMWNDFFMGLWQLSRDPRYVCRLHKHLKHGNFVQLNTGAWMITSVCQQDPEFAECWRKTQDAHGLIDWGGAISI